MEAGLGVKVGWGEGQDYSSEGSHPSEAGSLGHVRKHTHDLLSISGVNILVYYELKEDGVEPRYGFCTVSIKGFGEAKSEFDCLQRGHVRWWGKRCEWWWSGGSAEGRWSAIGRGGEWWDRDVRDREGGREAVGKGLGFFLFILEGEG